MPKQFATYKQQVEALIQQKHFVVKNKKYAIETLKRIGYFNLVTGTKELFKGENGEYLEGVNFDDLVAVYDFDQELRALFLQYVLVIERHVKSALSYCFSEKYKDDESAYLNPQNYNLKKENLEDINMLILALSKILREADKRYIEHSRQKYKNVPLWVLANSMSFGATSKMYALMRDNVKSKICSNIYFLGPADLLANMLGILTEFRNVCAHNERLFCYKTDKAPLPVLTMHKNLQIPIENDRLKYGTNDLFAVTIIFRHILMENDFDDFFSSLVKLLGSFRVPSGVINSDVVFASMGFPKNWKNMLILSVNRNDILPASQQSVEVRAIPAQSQQPPKPAQPEQSQQNKQQPAQQNKQQPAQQNKQPAQQNKQPAQQNKQPAQQNKQPAQQNKQPAQQNKQPAQQNKQPAQQNKQSAQQNNQPAQQSTQQSQKEQVVVVQPQQAKKKNPPSPQKQRVNPQKPNTSPKNLTVAKQPKVPK